MTDLPSCDFEERGWCDLANIDSGRLDWMEIIENATDKNEDWMRILASDGHDWQPQIDYTNYPNRTGRI